MLEQQLWSEAQGPLHPGAPSQGVPRGPSSFGDKDSLLEAPLADSGTKRG